VGFDMLGGHVCYCGAPPKLFADPIRSKETFAIISYAYDDWKGAHGSQTRFKADFELEIWANFE